MIKANQNSKQKQHSKDKNQNTMATLVMGFQRENNQIQTPKKMQDIRNEKWEKDEDKCLLLLVNRFYSGTHDWDKISKHMTRRSSTNVKRRWFNALNPMLKKDVPFSDEEIWIYYLLARHHQGKVDWPLIGKYLLGRNKYSVISLRVNQMTDSKEIYIIQFDKIFSYQFKLICQKNRIEFQGTDLSKIKDPNSQYKRVLENFEQDFLKYKLQELKQQNIKFYSKRYEQYLQLSKQDDYYEIALQLMAIQNPEMIQQFTQTQQQEIKFQVQYQEQLEIDDTNDKLNQKSQISQISKIKLDQGDCADALDDQNII